MVHLKKQLFVLLNVENKFVSSSWRKKDKKSILAQSESAAAAFPRHDPMLIEKFVPYQTQNDFEHDNQFFRRRVILAMQHLSWQLVMKPDWAIYWTLGNFFKPLATINLPNS